MNAKELFDQTINEFKVGDVVVFNIKNSFLKIKGEIKDLFSLDDVFYLKIYSFFYRKEILFILNENLELILPEKYPEINDPNEIIIYNDFYPDDAIPSKNTLKLSFTKVILIIVIISLVLTINPYLKISFTPANFSYKTFLQKNFTLNQLYQTVISRLYYSYDVDEYWMTPEDAWNYKSGDCEEFANIISDYLNHHKIENYVTGLNIKDSAEGHAVVFAKIDSIFYILDATKASEPLGITKLKNIKTLKEAISLYSRLPAPVFQVPSYPGEKKVLYYVY